MASILVFGDSIGQGYFDKQGGWVSRLNGYCFQQELKYRWEQSINIFNLSITGNTIQEVINRLDCEAKSRTWESHKTYFIFAIGLNDSQLVYKTKKQLYSIAKFAKNLQVLVNKTKHYDPTVIFVGPTPVDEPKVNPMPWEPTMSYKNKSVENFNTVIYEFCNKNNLYFINLYSQLSKMDFRTLLEDGAHPNSKGHELIFKVIRNFLQKETLI